MSHNEIKRENKLLASELGSEYGHARYQWHYSENLHLPFATGKMNYEASPGGLLLAVPEYELRKAAKHLNRQWVVCKWLAPGDESTWRQTFGRHMDYPRNGIYFPTNVFLEPEINPWDTDEAGQSVTTHIIGLVRAQARKSLADLKAEGEAIIARREASTDHKIDEMVGDLLLPFGHIPGTRNSGVSLPSRESAANHDKVFGATAPASGPADGSQKRD